MAENVALNKVAMRFKMLVHVIDKENPETQLAGLILSQINSLMSGKLVV